MDPEPEPGGPKTSGSETLLELKSCFPCRNGPSVLSTKQKKAVYRAEPLPDQLPANKRPNIILFLTDDQARNANAIRCIAELTGQNPPALDNSCFSILALFSFYSNCFLCNKSKN